MLSGEATAGLKNIRCVLGKRATGYGNYCKTERLPGRLKTGVVITGNYLVITFEVITFSFTTQPYRRRGRARGARRPQPERRVMEESLGAPGACAYTRFGSIVTSIVSVETIIMGDRDTK